MKLLFTALILTLSISQLVIAQDPFSEDRDRQEEGEGQASSAKEDTTDLIPVESNLYWYDIENNLSLKTDSSRYEIHRLADEKKLIYMDMSDIFRTNHLFNNIFLNGDLGTCRRLLIHILIKHRCFLAAH